MPSNAAPHGERLGRVGRNLAARGRAIVSRVTLWRRRWWQVLTPQRPITSVVTNIEIRETMVSLMILKEYFVFVIPQTIYITMTYITTRRFFLFYLTGSRN